MCRLHQAHQQGTKLSIENAYDDWAGQYDTNRNKTRDLDAVATISVLSRYAFKSVLELGCGTGKNTGWLSKRAERVIGLDFSQGMLDIARGKITDSKVEFKKADLTKAWDIENESVDLVTSNLTLEHIGNLDHIFAQSYQKLIAGGLFFISEFHPFRQYEGRGAEYESENGTVSLQVYTHHISDYTGSAEKNGFKLIEIKEWFDGKGGREIPRLISFVFRKRKNE